MRTESIFYRYILERKLALARWIKYIYIPYLNILLYYHLSLYHCIIFKIYIIYKDFKNGWTIFTKMNKVSAFRKVSFLGWYHATSPELNSPKIFMALPRIPGMLGMWSGTALQLFDFGGLENTKSNARSVQNLLTFFGWKGWNLKPWNCNLRQIAIFFHETNLGKKSSGRKFPCCDPNLSRSS